jgi:hypothetical protein
MRVLLTICVILLIWSTVACAKGQIDIEFSDAELHLSNFAFPIEHITGSIHLNKGDFEARNLIFTVLDSVFRLDGSFSAGGKKRDLILRALELSPTTTTQLFKDIEWIQCITPPEIKLRFYRDETKEIKQFSIKTAHFILNIPEISPSFTQIQCRNLYARAIDSNHQLEVSPLECELLGGKLLYEEVLTKEPKTRQFNVLLNQLSLVRLADFFPKYRNHVTGIITIRCAGSPDRLTGSFMIKDGTVKDLPFIHKLAEQTAVKDLKELKIKEFSAVFIHQKENLAMNNVILRTNLVDAAFSLTITGKEEILSGNGWLRIKLKKLVSSGKLRKLGFIKNIFRHNTLRLKLRIKGTMKDPDIQIKL